MASRYKLNRALLIAAVFTALAGFGAGCGSDEEQASDEVPIEATPDLTLPEGGEALPEEDGSSSTTTDQDSSSGETDSESAETGSNSGGGESQSGSTQETPDSSKTTTQPSTTQKQQTTPTPAETGGTQAPENNGGTAPDDTSQNDSQPPQNSPAKRFETFCKQNPGAC